MRSEIELQLTAIQKIVESRKVEQICHVELTHGTHLYWPDLDVDLTFAIIEHPQRYPGVSK